MTKSQIFAAAHKIAKAKRINFSSYKESFSFALVTVYKSSKTPKNMKNFSKTVSHFTEMVPVDATMEWIKATNDSKTLHETMSAENKTKLKAQVASVWGEGGIVISQKGCVFSGEGQYLGRIDANFDFISR